MPVLGVRFDPIRQTSFHVEVIRIHGVFATELPPGGGFGRIGEDSFCGVDVAAPRVRRDQRAARAIEQLGLQACFELGHLSADRCERRFPPASATVSTTDMASRRFMDASIFWKDTSRIYQIPRLFGRDYSRGHGNGLAVAAARQSPLTMENGK